MLALSEFETAFTMMAAAVARMIGRRLTYAGLTGNLPA